LLFFKLLSFFFPKKKNLETNVKYAIVPVLERAAISEKVENAVHLVDATVQSPFTDHPSSDLLCFQRTDLKQRAKFGEMNISNMCVLNFFDNDRM
jgi:hypothetical protein